MRRRPMNTRKAAKQFNRRSSKTMRVNTTMPLRGGIRL